MNRSEWLFLVVVCVASGCHAPPVCRTPGWDRPTALPIDAELPVVAPTSLEPALTDLPTVDPNTRTPTTSTVFRGLTMDQCRRLAASFSPTANRLDADNARVRLSVGTTEGTCPPPSRLGHQLRELAAVAARNRDAGEALDRFWQLADAEGRTERLSAGLNTFDELRATVPQLRAAELPVPTDEELLRQRAKLLGDLETAEAGIQLLNADLRKRLGLSVAAGERLWPTGDFGVRPEPVDPEAAVTFALENRADLQLLRAAYHGLTAETLTDAGEYLPAGGAKLPTPPRPTGLPGFVQKQLAPYRTVAAAEVAARKQQLGEFIVEQERAVAAEVRAVAGQLASSERRIGLAKARVESWTRSVTAAGEKPADRLPVELERHKARAELLGEVMTWHRWRSGLQTAEGRHGWATSPSPDDRHGP